jgi:hypothetical protein
MELLEENQPLSPPKPEGPSPAPVIVYRDQLVIAVVFLAAVVLVGSMLVIAKPLGGLLLPVGGFRFLPTIIERHLIYPKPNVEMRYLLAVGFALGLGLVFARFGVPRTLPVSRAGRAGVRIAGVAGLITIVGLAAWGWWGQFRYTAADPPTAHFGNGDLLVAFVVAGALVLLAWVRPRWFGIRSAAERRPWTWMWLVVAALLTVCWLLPSVFREQNLAPAPLLMTYHLRFTFDDFAAVVDGRTPLVNYAEQYASLLPFLVWPVLRFGGTQIGTFTVTMCFLTFLSLVAVERVFVLVTHSERLGLALYVPFLATSLFFVLRLESQMFSWGSYYAVFPMRYLGPYVLLWLCVRHLRGMRPRSAIVVFAFADLVLLNNIEFGAPACLAGVAAVTMGTEPMPGRTTRLIKDLAIGFACALAAVAMLTLLFAGELPNFGLLTLFSRIFGEGGFGLLPTPVPGIYMVVYMTFAAAILVAAIRYHDGAADRAYTATLAYSGVFGLGAGNYYMGRTYPGALVVLFSIWSLNVMLLGLLSLRALATKRGRLRVTSLALVGGALVSVGLVSTAIAQFPAPRTQLRRIAASSPPPPPYNLSAAVAFLRRTAKPGEPIVLLAPLGHVIALYAHVENVSPYSNPEDVLTYEQINEEFTALHRAGGTRFYAAESVFPEILHRLASDGFTPTVDPASGIMEWRR